MRRLMIDLTPELEASLNAVLTARGNDGDGIEPRDHVDTSEAEADLEDAMIEAWNCGGVVDHGKEEREALEHAIFVLHDHVFYGGSPSGSSSQKQAQANAYQTLARLYVGVVGQPIPYPEYTCRAQGADYSHKPPTYYPARMEITYRPDGRGSIEQVKTIQRPAL